MNQCCLELTLLEIPDTGGREKAGCTLSGSSIGFRLSDEFIHHEKVSEGIQITTFNLM